MPRPIFDTKDAIPKGFEDEYEEKEGKWHPKEPAEMKALREERDKREASEKLAKRLSDERADLERKLTAATSGDEKGRVEKALAKFDEDAARMRADYDAKIKAKDDELRTLKLDDKAKAAFLKAGGRPEKADKALKLYKESLDLAEDGRIVIKDAKGEVTSASIEDFWGKTVRAEDADLFSGTKASGGGAKNGAPNGSPVPAGGKWDGDAVIADPLGALSAANIEAAG